MGFILQLQRRAIEAVFTECPLKISVGQTYYFDGEELSLLGVSVGVGTCSDMHGVDIAVFSKEEKFNPAFHRLPPLPKECRGAVLWRSCREGETDPKCPVGPGQSAAVYEGLTIADRQELAIHFTYNFRKRFYIELA